MIRETGTYKASLLTTKISVHVVVISLAASEHWPSNTNNLAFCFFLRNSSYTCVSIGAMAARGWLLASYYNLKKKVKSTKLQNHVCFNMARGGKWLRVAADCCNQLQLQAAKWLPKMAASGCMRLFLRIKTMHVCSLFAIPVCRFNVGILY